MNWPVIYITLFITTFLISFLLTPLMIPLAFMAGILDEPGERKIHKKVMPRLGGVAMLCAFILPLLAAAFFIFLTQKGFIEKDVLPDVALLHLAGMISVLPRLFYFLSGGLAIFIIGILDDKRNLAPWKKLLSETAVIASVVTGGLKFSIFPDIPLLSAFLTIIWILAITNAFNLLDNLDGLSAGVALISSLIFLSVALANRQYFVATLLVIFSGSITGFLPYNFYPARIFMGDGGSLFIGYVMGGLTVLGTFYREGQPTLLALIMPVIILAVPLYDTGSVLFIRMREKRSIWKGDTSHFSHRLIALGMSERMTCLFIYLVTFSLGISATLLRQVNLSGGIIILLWSVSVLSVIAILEFSAKR